jgi:hypothetical protein
VTKLITTFFNFQKLINLNYSCMNFLINTMKQPVMMAVTIIFVFTAVYSCSAGEPTFTRVFYNIETPGALEVKTSGGGITVVGIDGNQVTVNAYVRKNGTLLSSMDPLVQELNDGFEIEIEQYESTIAAIAKRRVNSMPWKQISISFHVEVPHDMACNLNTSGGGVELSGVNGFQQINTSGGGIKLNNIQGNTHAHTSGGGIHIENIMGKTDVKTSGGGITIVYGRGDIKAHTSGGAIKLENILGAVDAHTSGGGIRVSGETNYVKATTSGGSIHVNITGLGNELYLNTSGGGIHATIPRGLGLDLAANAVNMELINFNGFQKKNKIQGSMNGGGIPVHMHTSGGNVNVQFN